MTAMLDAYLEIRDRGRSHDAALRILARQIDVDRNTTARTIGRAQDAHRRPPAHQPHPNRETTA